MYRCKAIFRSWIWWDHEEWIRKYQYLYKNVNVRVTRVRKKCLRKVVFIEVASAEEAAVQAIKRAMLEDIGDLGGNTKDHSRPCDSPG